MTKKLRQQVYEKYNGLCGYTGKPLDDKWQVDHIRSKQFHKYYLNPTDDYKKQMKELDNINNLIPTFRIINHYKRALDLEGFRKYMMNLHIRMAKLPKNTKIPKMQKRKDYINKVAELFDISVDKPFNGIFYFETF